MLTMEFIINQMESWAPTHWAEDFDNVGLLVGSYSQPVKKVMVALDATIPIIKEAIAKKCDCIITHHPILRESLKQINSQTSAGLKIMMLLQNNISLYTAHTNLDKAPGGVNCTLAKKLGFTSTKLMYPCPTNANIGYGRIATVDTTLKNVLLNAEKALGLKKLAFTGDINMPVKRIGMCGGSGMSFWQQAKNAGCQVYLTGDVKYSDALAAQEAGLSVVDITHYVSENVIVEEIVKKLQNANPDIEVFATEVGNPVFVL